LFKNLTQKIFKLIFNQPPCSPPSSFYRCYISIGGSISIDVIVPPTKKRGRKRKTIKEAKTCKEKVWETLNVPWRVLDHSRIITC